VLALRCGAVRWHTRGGLAGRSSAAATHWRQGRAGRPVQDSAVEAPGALFFSRAGAGLARRQKVVLW